MNDQASIPVSDHLRSERTSTKTLHKYIFSLLTMLGVLLQLKQGAGTASSLFDTHYTTVVILIVALIVYGGSLIGSTYIREAHCNLNLEKFMNKISLLFGALALVLDMVILIPALGVAALLFWIVWFVSFVAFYSYPYVKTLFTSAVAGAVHAVEILNECLRSMTIARWFSMNANEEEQTRSP